MLLLTPRIVQGFALGGEWAGAMLLAVEHSPDDRRGIYGSAPQIGLAERLPAEFHRHTGGIVEAGERQRDLRTVCAFAVLSAGGQLDLRAVRVLLLLAGDDNGGGDDRHRQQACRDHDRLSAPPPMGAERLGRRTAHQRAASRACATLGPSMPNWGRVARQLNGCSPSTVYLEELLDERAAAF